jgi:hypothetical protein
MQPDAVQGTVFREVCQELEEAAEVESAACKGQEAAALQGVYAYL